jgi:hypothetical protein
MTSPCPDESYPSQFGWSSGGQTPVEAYVGIKRLYQGILYEGSGQSVIPGSNKQLSGMRSCCLAPQNKARRTALIRFIGKVGEFPDIENILFACILASVFVSVRK